MAKWIDSKTAVYEIKATNPNAIANFDSCKLVKAIGDDLARFVGKPMQGSPATRSRTSWASSV